MSPQARKRIGLAVGALSLAAVVGAMVMLARRQQKLAGLGLIKPKYRFVNQRYSQAPVIGTSENGGMRIEHRRSALMPIEERVASIQDLVWKGVNDPVMRKLALKIT